MKVKLPVVCGIGVVSLILCSCTERRTASEPVADGDTVEVVIAPEQN